MTWGVGVWLGYEPGSALLTAVCINRWTAAEADEYVHHIQNVTSSRGSQEWKFDLQWLSDHDLSIPKHLQSLCHATHH